MGQQSHPISSFDEEINLLRSFTLLVDAYFESLFWVYNNTCRKFLALFHEGPIQKSK